VLVEGGQVVALPRYAQFGERFLPMVRGGLRPVAIAGNRQIMLTAISDEGWRYDLGQGAAVFEQEILTEPARKRVAIDAPVAALPGIVAELDRRGIRVEHVYDY
jgi:hypothetical protein